MKRIIIILLLALAGTAFSAEPTQKTKNITLTLTQEQLDNIVQNSALAFQQKALVQESIIEASNQLRLEMYGLFALLSIVIALSSISFTRNVHNTQTNYNQRLSNIESDSKPTNPCKRGKKRRH